MAPTERPEISVLLPARNAESTISEALGSVLSTDDRMLEVVMVDDGSTDETSAIAAELTRRDPRLRVLRTEGIGIAAALGLAAREARAPLFARMDADDISLPGRFRAQRAAILAPGAERIAALGTRIEVFGESLSDGLARFVDWQNGLLSPSDHARELYVESPLCHPSVMMPRAAFEALGGYREGPFAEDYDLWLRARRAGWKLAKLPEVFVRWRRHPGQLTHEDSRCSPEAMRALKARHLAAEAPWRRRRLVQWGAGRDGRRFARALEQEEIRPAAFVDVDPKKIGRVARGAPIVDSSALLRDDYVVVCVGARGAREEIRAHLAQRGFRERDDFICVA